MTQNAYKYKGGRDPKKTKGMRGSSALTVQADLLSLCKQGTAFYGRVPLDVLADPRLENSDVRLYGIMAFHTWEGTVCTVPIRQLAEMSTLSMSQVMRSLARLVGLKYIERAAGNRERKRSWFELKSPVFGQKQGKVEVVRGGRLVSAVDDQLPPEAEESVA